MWMAVLLYKHCVQIITTIRCSHGLVDNCFTAYFPHFTHWVSDSIDGWEGKVGSETTGPKMSGVPMDARLSPPSFIHLQVNHKFAYLH